MTILNALQIEDMAEVSAMVAAEPATLYVFCLWRFDPDFLADFR
jgi:hypothetical protein